MTEDVVAVSAAALESGYDQVIAVDSHGNAHNIEPDRLPENVALIRSWPRPLFQMQGIEDPDVVACAFVGYHAEASAQDSNMAHVFNGAAFRSVSLNGELCSEGYLNAALAGEFGRPIVFVSGDDATIEDSKRYAPESVGYVTKSSIGYRSQMSLPPAQVRVGLRERSLAAFQAPLGEPFKVAGPFVLDLEMTTQTAAEMLCYLPGFERVGAWIARTRPSSVASAVRVVAFAALYTPTGLPAI